MNPICNASPIFDPTRVSAPKASKDDEWETMESRKHRRDRKRSALDSGSSASSSGSSASSSSSSQPGSVHAPSHGRVRRSLTFTESAAARNNGSATGAAPQRELSNTPIRSSSSPAATVVSAPNMLNAVPSDSHPADAGSPPPSSTADAPPSKARRTAEATTAHAGIATATSRPPSLFQDAVLLKNMHIDPTRLDTLVVRCAGNPEDILGTAYVQRAETGEITSLMLPPRKLHTQRARRWLRRALRLPPPTVDIVPPSNATDGTSTSAPTAATVDEFIRRATTGTSPLEPLTFAIFATSSISISLPPLSRAKNSFTLRFHYCHADLGKHCLSTLRSRLADSVPELQRKERKDSDSEGDITMTAAAPVSSSASSRSVPKPFLSVMPARDRFVCGVIRRWPWRGLAPSVEDVDRQLSSLGITAVRMKPILSEQCFIGEMQFAVPVRYSKQLELLKGWSPQLRILKKVQPPVQACSKCWQRGHSRNSCLCSEQCCKHCGKAHSLPLDGSICPTLQHMRHQWPACLLCEKRGHCVTACPQFRPQLVPMELRPRKPDFGRKEADFPAAVATSATPTRDRHNDAAKPPPPSKKATTKNSTSKGGCQKQTAPVADSPAAVSYAAVAAGAQGHSQTSHSSTLHTNNSQQTAAAATAASSGPSPVLLSFSSSEVVSLLQEMRNEILRLKEHVSKLSVRVCDLGRSAEDDDLDEDADVDMDDIFYEDIENSMQNTTGDQSRGPVQPSRSENAVPISVAQH
jgi:hypothetical protein